MAALDWVFVAVLLASMLIGAWRGLVFEVLSVLGWVVSFFVAWLAIRWLMRLISHHTLEAFGWYRIVLSLIIWWTLA